MKIIDELAAGEKHIVGEGSFGKVYRYTYNNEQFAVKKILKDPKNHPQLIEKIESEGKIMQRASNHRNIVGYVGEKTEGKFHYILTQFVPDGDLRRVNFLPSEDDLWEIIMQMGMALHHLKKNKIIHRDIKPENILVKSSEANGCQPEIVLKLTDFGLAQIMDTKSQLQGIAGSPIYLAPQMCKYETYSYQIDIWSLGITLYQLAHQQKSPYHQQIHQFMSVNQYKHTDKSLFNYLMGLIQTKIIKCSSPYPLINQLIQSMLSQDPKRRPNPLQILQHRKVLERLVKFNQNQKNNMFMGKTLSTKDSHRTENIKQNNNQMNTPKKGQQEQLMIYSPSLQLFLSSRVSDSLIHSIRKDSYLNSGRGSYELISFSLIPSKI